MPQDYRRSNIFFENNGKLYRFLWIDQGRDKSVYVGPFSDDYSIRSIAILESNRSRVNYDEFKFLESLRKPKISYHTTGQTHFRGYVKNKKNKPVIIANQNIVKNITQPTQIALVGIPEIETLPVLNESIDLSKDIVIPISSFSDYPFAARIILSPLVVDVPQLSHSEKGFLALANFRSSSLQLSIVLYRYDEFKSWSKYLMFGVESNFVK